MSDLLRELYTTIYERRQNPQEGSYTCYLFDKGTDKILKKCGEESAEVIIAAKGGNKTELIGEISDLFYHLVVLMVNEGVSLEEINEELARRSQKTGNLKQFHAVDKNT